MPHLRIENGERTQLLLSMRTGGEMGMNVKEAIDVLERSCDFHYEETDKCYGCLFENSGWCDEDFHDSLLTLLKQIQKEPIKRTNQNEYY